jgi:RNA polymerase sigma factor (TIGR02999 family)
MPGGHRGVARTPTTVRRLLSKLEEGDREATDELVDLLYGELRELAHVQRLRWQGNHTVNTTALVHEAYLKLVGQERIGVVSRAHFLAFAARAMRHVLCNHARDRGAQKRGGGLRIVPMDAETAIADPRGPSVEPSSALLALDDALERLEAVDPRRARVVECRFFGGMTVEETAAALAISGRTVQRDWAVAQAWLHRELTRPARELRGR